MTWFILSLDLFFFIQPPSPSLPHFPKLYIFSPSLSPSLFLAQGWLTPRTNCSLVSISTVQVLRPIEWSELKKGPPKHPAAKPVRFKWSLFMHRMTKEHDSWEITSFRFGTSYLLCSQCGRFTMCSHYSNRSLSLSFKKKWLYTGSWFSLCHTESPGKLNWVFILEINTKWPLHTRPTDCGSSANKRT